MNTHDTFVKNHLGLIYLLYEKYNITDLNVIKQLIHDGTVKIVK